MLTYGLQGTSIWLDDEHKYVMEDYHLGGEVIAEFKMKAWEVTVLSPDASPHLISVDPYITVGDLIAQLTTKFSLPATEEYSLMFTHNNVDTWLLENKPILSVGKLYEVGHVLQLQTKPKPLKVYRFKEEACEVLQITGNSTVHQLLKQLAVKYGVGETSVREYGLQLAKGADGSFLDEARTLASCNLADGMGAVRFVMRPVTYNVTLPDGTAKSFSLLRNVNVKQIISEIADQQKLEVDEGYSLYSVRRQVVIELASVSNKCIVQLPTGGEKLLEDWKTLTDQAVGETDGLALRKDPSKKKKDWFTVRPLCRDLLHSPPSQDSGVPIWEEKGDHFVVYSEVKAAPGAPAPHAPKKEISCASLNQLVEYLTSEKEHGMRVPVAYGSRLTLRPDMDFVKAFLLTYRSFTSPEIFIKKLGERWACPSSVDKGRQQVIKLRICTPACCSRCSTHSCIRHDDHPVA